MSDMLTLDEAATALNRSHRTIQRWVASGRLKAQVVDGRTMVEVERPAGEAIAAIQRQAEDAGKVAALAAVTGQQAALAYHERADELVRVLDHERRATRGWRWGAIAAGVIGVASLVTLAATWTRAGATRDIVTATEARASTAERALERTESALEASQRERERLVQLVADMTRHDIVAAIDAGQRIAMAELDACE
jgi:excisionase family DNA binding protein